uniref:Uncharacterized protein n=1 Tax=Rhizophora mucronata TaxID=61149 RepID=A0A2P2NW59_RHIMU
MCNNCRMLYPFGRNWSTRGTTRTNSEPMLVRRSQI